MYYTEIEFVSHCMSALICIILKYYLCLVLGCIWYLCQTWMVFVCDVMHSQEMTRQINYICILLKYYLCLIYDCIWYLWDTNCVILGLYLYVMMHICLNALTEDDAADKLYLYNIEI